MKALILNVLILLMGCSICSAQFNEEVETSKGKRFFIGGSINFDKSENVNTFILLDGTIIISSSNNNSENNSYTINPVVGFKITNKWVIGLDFLLRNTNSESNRGLDNSQIQESSSNSIGFFVRYIFNPENKFQVFTSPYFRKTSEDFSFSFGTSTINQFTSEQSSNNLGISLGAQYEFTDWIRATTNIGGFYYSSGSIISADVNSTESETDFTSSGFNFRGSSIFFGVEFLF